MSTVVRFPQRRRAAVLDQPAPAFQTLTWTLLLDQHRRGALDPRLLEYLMAGAGLQP